MLTLHDGSATSKFRDQFLSRFATERRSRVVNLFTVPARNLRLVSSDALLAHVRQDLDQRIREAMYWGGRDLDALVEIRDVIEAHPEEARRFASWAISWASLPAGVREQVKVQRAERYRREWMAHQPPTERQLAYLYRLGYAGSPPSNRAEASELIDRLAKGATRDG
ncbi:hypothetical protein caldi_10120 [Caldinitratiruptor microaerophilus]|uniref:Uncharacterized protein n=1 Tax=Caldinitratiruptor microaerophilus TaxID=671077 RepID=A0AA35CLV0_9FIRM|nr:hypothetical protein caldi_10120 [Caldinitratiruptor microaerophilus]